MAMVVALFALSALVAPGSLSASSLATTIPFASVLAIAAIGQTLVVQQGGLDFSIGGTMTLSAVLVCTLSDAVTAVVAIAVIAAAALLTGLVSGVAVAYLRVGPLIATLGVNALLLGSVQAVSGGALVAPAPAGLTRFALDRSFGVFNLLLAASALVAVGTVVLKRSVAGRRFEAVGAAPAAAAAAGLPVRRYVLAAYVLASCAYAVAGVLLAGFLSTPPLDVGNSYLLTGIAAVVLGGTALGGGPGSVLGSAIGALFLTQLGQLLLATGWRTSSIFLVEGAIIGLGVASRAILPRVARRRPFPEAPPDQASEPALERQAGR